MTKPIPLPKIHIFPAKNPPKISKPIKNTKQVVFMGYAKNSSKIAAMKLISRPLADCTHSIRRKNQQMLRAKQKQ